ncbi:unnamed protein product [Rhodiola kirilowii]
MDTNLGGYQEERNRVLMDSPSASPRPYEGSAAVSTPGSNDESQRVKFLCSFSGSIIPRPQDGKLRYVGGETRIVSVPRDIKYEDLMSRMKELFEEANLLKYQQPDEDLDALVSVVNDDDVTNMMEEYDKLGSGDGFIRLRIFLFSHPDQDVPLHFIESDERDSERRYVDALNNMNDPSDFRNQQWNDSPRLSFVDDMYAGDQYFSAGTEGSVHNQRNWDNIMPSYNLQHAQYGSGQLQQIPGHRYGDMEPPWNPAPAFYSPRHHGHFDPRTSEFPHSPSSARYRMPVEFSDGRFSEDYVRPAQVIQHPQQNPHPTMMERQPQQPHNAPSGHMAGFPGNVLHDTNQVEGNSICGQCRMTYKRNPPDVEYSHMGNGLQQAFDPCNVCHPNTESGWTPRNQLNPRAEGPRGFLPSDGRLGDRYIVDGSGFTTPIGNYNLQDGPLAASNYSQFEEQRYVRPGYEFGAEPFVNKAAPLGPHIQSHVHEVPYGNPPLVYGTENSCQVQYGHVPSHGSWKNVQTPLRHGSELPASPLTNGVLSSGYHRTTKEGSPTMHIGTNNQNVVHASPEVGGLDASAMLEYPHGHALRLNTRHLKHRPDNPGAIQSMPDNPGAIQSMPDDPSIVQSIPDNFVYDVEPVDFLIPASALVSDQVVIADLGSRKENNYAPAVTVEENGSREAKGTLVVEHNGGIEQNNTGDENQAGMTVIESVGTHVSEPSNENADEEKVGEKDPTVLLETKLSVEQLSFLPELIASVKKAALEGAEEVKAKFQDHNSSAVLDDSPDKEKNPVEIGDTQADGDSDSDNVDTSKIEPTEAEAEAIARGLQTIKNDDLEEIRELGTGTYGAVFHGKWKGSDVAVKRIKASCFAGKQRERLIADFWKEALLLSSLHHPNIVTFYGIVRDGPDSTLATVTEFMTNGSLKQFLQKKDRTIDRRKRLIIAMDAAFGMEYLHGKNIVHFDLKCENLLVNMKDPQRPVCKIGDMGLSKVKQHTLVSGGVRGTLPWMAPELLSGKSNMVSENVDVYSFGIVLWELLTGDEPYKDMHCASIIGGIVNNTLRPQIPSWCDPEWKSLMESCWASNPVDRPSFSEISQKLRNMAAAMNVK